MLNVGLKFTLLNYFLFYRYLLINNTNSTFVGDVVLEYARNWKHYDCKELTRIFIVKAA